MTNYVFYTSNGEIKIIYSGQCLDQMIEINPDLSYIEGSIDSSDNYYVENNELVEKPSKPSNFHLFDYSTKEWTLPTEQIEKAKTQKKLDITNQADWIHQQPISYDNKLLDADETAQQNISGKITELKNDIDLNITSTNLFWKDANNVLHTWNTPAEYLSWLQGLFNAITARRTNLYALSWQGKAAIDAMTNVEDIQAYDIITLFNT